MRQAVLGGGNQEVGLAHDTLLGVANMSQGEERSQTLDFAVARYKQGSCPSCGKKFGEPRGLEYRNKSSDLYCHTCKRRWPIELDIGALRDELCLSKAPQAGSSQTVPCQSETPFVSVPGLSVNRAESAKRRVAGRFGSLFHRILLRH